MINSLSALHCIVGAKLLNTLSGSAACTIAFSAVTAAICFFVSLPRTLNQMSDLGTFSAVTMGIAILLVIIFSGVQDYPFGFISTSPIVVTAFPIEGTTYVSGNVFFIAHCTLNPLY